MKQANQDSKKAKTGFLAIQKKAYATKPAPQVAKLEKQEAKVVKKEIKKAVKKADKLKKTDPIAAQTVALEKSLQPKLGHEQKKATKAKEMMQALVKARARQMAEVAGVKELQTHVNQLERYSTPDAEDHAKLDVITTKALTKLKKSQEKLKATQSYIRKLTKLSSGEENNASKKVSKVSKKSGPTVEQLEAKNKALKDQAKDKAKQEKKEVKTAKKKAEKKAEKKVKNVEKKAAKDVKKVEKEAKRAMKKTKKVLKKQI